MEGNCLRVMIVTPAHNEEETIGQCLCAVRKMKAPNGVNVQHVVVLDRCTDRTGQICESHGVKVLVKDWRGSFVSPIVEAMDFALKKVDGDLMMKVDADIQVTEHTLERLLPHLKGNIACVSAEVKSRTGKKHLDALMWFRDLNYRIAPLGRKIHGACTLFRGDITGKIGGFDPDAPAWDTGYELKLNKHGYKAEVAEDVIVLEYRETNVRKLIRHQIDSGKARRKMRIGFPKTLLHAIFRGRPFVIWGYLFGDMAQRTNRYES